ncbi:MAG: PaaI family thioesterase [Blastocatellia bacterium]|nr:PaaI family thioesterase [Chloracidobacterium sp.]MBL8184079.1 PaaI family thioesterase [Blastocatellia bacterium]HBE82076.1 esterase [Blastocatellia bacterium]HRJ89750.1 PaaI family thioesterase [Pyrinomonadaceae bacterium]HRK49679.1 PaaI family thioesterase [Pyrinomonadaceae bacterium]
MDRSELIARTAENELMRFLGVNIVETTPEHVVLTMEVTPKVHQYVGIMNGGVSLYLAETAASIGVVSNADLTKVTPVGIEINGNHLRAVSKGLLTVEARPIYPGRTMSVWQIDITNDRQKLIFTGRITILLQNRPAFPAISDDA